MKLKNLPEWLKIVNLKQKNQDADEGEDPEQEGDEIVMAIHAPIGEMGGVTSESFGHVLCQIPKDKRVALEINCMGGDVSHGIAIHNMLMARGNVTTRVVGYAASMGAVIAQAGAKRQMMPGTMMVIHNPQTTATGEAKDMNKIAEMLGCVKASLVDLFSKRTGQGKREVSDMMDAVTTMSGKDAKKLGFCDELMEGSPAWNQMDPLALHEALNGFKAAPKINSLGESAGESNNNNKTMKLTIAALTGLIKLPETTTDEQAAPQVQASLQTMLSERDNLRTENTTLKTELDAHRAALKVRVTNRVQAAIDAKVIKAERKDSLIAIGIKNEADLDFLSDVQAAQPQARRGAPPVPNANGEGAPTYESVRNEMSTARSGDMDPAALGSLNAKLARQARELRGHGSLFATDKK